MNPVGPILTRFGWDAVWTPEVESTSSNEYPGRVTRAGRLLTVRLEQGEVLATCPDYLGERPVCGDWVLTEVYENPGGNEGRGRISSILTRRNAITRRAAGLERPQALVANIDHIWLVCSLDRSQGLRSLPRYQALCRLPNVLVTVVLNKADLCDDVVREIALARTKSPGLDVVTIAALHHRGLESLEDKLGEHRTVAVLGPSGAGKSTLVNTLAAGPKQRTRDVRQQDHRGCHTTSESRLLETPAGTLIIDTPGLRELGLWQSTGFDHSYADILELAQQCRFSDCKHDREPGCYVRLALDRGLLSSERFLEYLELSRECGARAQFVKGRKPRRH